jgi:hypothetical protein
VKGLGLLKPEPLLARRLLRDHPRAAARDPHREGFGAAAGGRKRRSVRELVAAPRRPTPLEAGPQLADAGPSAVGAAGEHKQLLNGGRRNQQLLVREGAGAVPNRSPAVHLK